MQWRRAFVIAAVVGCGDNTNAMIDANVDAEVDAGPPGPCWVDPVDMTPTGTAVLGTGDDGFEAMPSELPIVFGSQNGFNVVAHVRMKGLIPGDPTNVFNPGNPKTRILSYFADTGIPLNKAATCPFRVGYKPIDAETYEMAKGVGIIFDTCWRDAHLIGKQLRIKLWMLDDENGYTTDERVVTMVAPTDPGYPTGEGMPGCLQVPEALSDGWRQ